MLGEWIEQNRAVLTKPALNPGQDQHNLPLLQHLVGTKVNLL